MPAREDHRPRTVSASLTTRRGRGPHIHVLWQIGTSMDSTIIHVSNAPACQTHVPNKKWREAGLKYRGKKASTHVWIANLPSSTNEARAAMEMFDDPNRFQEERARTGARRSHLPTGPGAKRLGDLGRGALTGRPPPPRSRPRRSFVDPRLGVRARSSLDELQRTLLDGRRRTRRSRSRGPTSPARASAASRRYRYSRAAPPTRGRRSPPR